MVRKLPACLRVYVRLIRYAANSNAPVIHILWNYKIALFDRNIFAPHPQFLSSPHTINTISASDKCLELQEL